MSTLRIVIEIDWLTIALMTAAVVGCMGAYKVFFYEEDSDEGTPP